MNCLRATNRLGHHTHLTCFANAGVHVPAKEGVPLPVACIAFCVSFFVSLTTPPISTSSVKLNTEFRSRNSRVAVSSDSGSKTYRDVFLQVKGWSSCDVENRRVIPSPTHISIIPSAASSSMEALSLNEAASTDSKEATPKADPIVQYIVLRKDLVDTMKWPLGSVISQGCHAAVAVIWLHKDDSVTAEYCGSENLDHMHKVTLEVKGETQLRNLAQKLETGGVAHKLWMEQPENIPTCLATKPYPKSEVASFFKSLKLCR